MSPDGEKWLRICEPQYHRLNVPIWTKLFIFGGSVMQRVTSTLLLLILTITLSGIAAWAQDDASGASATCNFDQEKQLVVQYEHVQVNLKKPLSTQVPFGKVWAPGGKSMTLFTNTPIQIGSRMLPIGAYTLFL